MGIILKFDARRKPRREASVANGRRGPCEIIILPCIRYEHSVDAVARPKPQKKPRKPRARTARQAK
jgi:hypothetical protein